jgi:hypothetical protein
MLAWVTGWSQPVGMCFRHPHGRIDTFQRQHHIVIGIDLNKRHMFQKQDFGHELHLTVVSLVTINSASPVGDLELIDRKRHQMLLDVILCLIDRSWSKVGTACLCIEMCHQLVPSRLYSQQQAALRNELQA